MGTPQVVGNDVLITTDNPSTGAGGTTYVADINATTGAKLGSTILLGAGSFFGPPEVVGTNALITAENPNSGGTTYVEDIDVTKGTQVGSTITLPGAPWGGGDSQSITGPGDIAVNPSETTQVAVSPTGPDAGDIFVASEGQELSMINPTTHAVTTIPVPGGADTVAISPITGDIYVGNGLQQVSVINPATNEVVATISVPHGAWGLAVSPTTGDIYATSGYAAPEFTASDTVSVINPATNEVFDTITVSGTPDGVAVSPTGPDTGDIYVEIYNGPSADGTVAVITPGTNHVTTIDLGYPVYSGLDEVAVSPVGTQAGDVYVTNTESGWVSVINPANPVVDHIDLNNFNHQAGAIDDIAVSPTTGDIYATTDGAVGTSGGAVFVLGPSGPSSDALLQTITTQLDAEGVAAAGPAGVPGAGDVYVTFPGNITGKSMVSVIK